DVADGLGDAAEVVIADDQRRAALRRFECVVDLSDDAGHRNSRGTLPRARAVRRGAGTAKRRRDERVRLLARRPPPLAWGTLPAPHTFTILAPSAERPPRSPSVRGSGRVRRRALPVA